VESLPPIVGICTGDPKGAVRIGNRLAQQIPLLLDGAEDAASAYKVSGYPTAVVLDGKRRIRAYRGISTADDLKRLVASTAAGDINLERAIAITPPGQSA
jgi:hypothetical protein